MIGIVLLGAQVSAQPLRSIFRVRIPEPENLNLMLPNVDVDEFVDLEPANIEYLYYPYGQVNKQSGRQILRSPPWAITENPDCKVWRSHFVTMRLESYFSQLAPGLNVSYREVFNALERHFCVPYVVGGLIRDILWQRDGLDTDIGFTCPLAEIKQICENHGWPVLLRPSKDYMRMGKSGVTDPIEGKPVEDSLYAPIASLEYTVNSLAYDAGINSAIIDRTGHGVDDDRSKTIRIPGDRSEWDGWAEGPDGTVKIFRFWKLRAKPKVFKAELATQAFIIGELKKRMSGDRKQETQDVGRKQLSHYLLGLDSEEAQEKLGFIRDAMIEDIGEDWYNLHIRPLEPQLPISIAQKGNTIMV